MPLAKTVAAAWLFGVVALYFYAAIAAFEKRGLPFALGAVAVALVVAAITTVAAETFFLKRWR